MKKTLNIFLGFLLTVGPCMALDLRSIVINSDTNEPIEYASIFVKGTRKNTNTDINGKFLLQDVDQDDDIIISIVGYKQQEIVASDIGDSIYMEPHTNIDEVIVTFCKTTDEDKKKGIKSKKTIDGECYPSECIEPRWKLSNSDKDAKCVEQKCKIKNGTGEWVTDGDTWKCAVKSCDKNYKENDDKSGCIEMLEECTDEQKATHPNATKTDIKKGTETCIALECKCGYDVKNDECVAWPTDENGKYKKPCDDNQLKKLNAKSGILYCENDKPKCEITACISDGYTHNTETNTCDSKNKQPCTHADKNVTESEYRNINGTMVCFATECITGWDPSDDGLKCDPEKILTKEDSEKQVQELEDNAEKMRDKEQSTENKLLGAAAIGATGIGGMMLASGLTEQSADEDAEQAMRAYLATFHCDYGGDKVIAGGEQEIQLPGGNELIGLYSEYIALANDLRVRKEQLGLAPGIESEPILDGATSGLYNDVSVGKTSGAYASLARALSDPNGQDAQMWATQREETSKNIKSGGITAGIGAAGGAIGNTVINSDKDKKDKTDEILKKYDEKRVSSDTILKDKNN